MGGGGIDTQKIKCFALITSGAISATLGHLTVISYYGCPNRVSQMGWLQNWSLSPWFLEPRSPKSLGWGPLGFVLGTRWLLPWVILGSFLYISVQGSILKRTTAHPILRSTLRTSFKLNYYSKVQSPGNRVRVDLQSLHTISWINPRNTRSQLAFLLLNISIYDQYLMLKSAVLSSNLSNAIVNEYFYDSCWKQNNILLWWIFKLFIMS